MADKSQYYLLKNIKKESSKLNEIIVEVHLKNWFITLIFLIY